MCGKEVWDAQQGHLGWPFGPRRLVTWEVDMGAALQRLGAGRESRGSAETSLRALQPSPSRHTEASWRLLHEPWHMPMLWKDNLTNKTAAAPQGDLAGRPHKAHHTVFPPLSLQS